MAEEQVQGQQGGGDQQQQPQQTMPQGSEADQKDIEENKVLAAISYIWLVSLIVLLVKKDSKFAQFHAKQGLVLAILSIIFAFIPFVGWILNLVIFVAAIIGIIQAASGKYWKLPLLGGLAAKINF